MTKNLFLLGGRDLEMLEIAKLLTQNNISFFDKQLSWGATLSAYNESFTKFSEFETVWGIELTEDVEKNAIPPNYRTIDHHNASQHLPASIEQVAHILGVKLNHYQQLVAANDKGYIPAMQAMGANNQEIELIRRHDRAAQGVTEQDEQLAEKSLAENKRQIADVIVVKSLTPKFSTICDRLFPTPKLIVYTDTELNYYGVGKQQLVEHYKTEIENNKAYHGGGENGFFGLPNTEINENIINEIIKIVKPYSYHIFLFPFRWDFKAEDKKFNEIEISKRFSLIKFEKCLLADNKWDRKYFEIVDSDAYNTSSYYYDFVGDAIFDEKERNMQDKVTINFKYKLNNNENFFTLNLVKKDKNDNELSYNLNLEKVELKAHVSGVAIMSFFLSNYKYPEKEAVLNINDFGRRIYPQFLEKDFGIKETKKTFLADNIVLEINGKPIRENFNYYTNSKNLKTTSFVLPNHLKYFLGENFVTSENQLKENQFLIKWITDDRMFVISWYGNNELSKELSKHYSCGNRAEYNYESSEFWYQYIFADNGYPTCQNKNMMRNFIKNHTYERWSGVGTFYGISRYSFVVLADRGDFSTNIVLTHIKTIYKDMVSLALAQRASILRYSDEVTHISSILNDEKQKTDNIGKLNASYLKFMNKMYFREVTAQEQGIELYDLIQNHMRIERDVKDLSREIDELYQYANLLEEAKENRNMKNISIWGAALLVPSLIAAILGMNTFDYEKLCEILCNSLGFPDYKTEIYNFGSVFMIILVIVSGYLAHRFVKRKIEKNR